MTKPFTSTTFAEDYRDDFKDSDNYHRILFNGGRDLQPRELTQMQSIIQAELSRLGNNIFYDGAAVNPKGASTSLDANYRYIKLDGTGFAGNAASDLVGLLFTGAESGATVRVKEAVDAENGDPATLYVSYETLSDIDNFRAAKDGEDLVSGAITLVAATTDATGYGMKLFVGGGDFYINGRFVFVEPQSLFISKYTNNVTQKEQIGYVVTQDIVTTNDTDDLYDNQGVVPNKSAPGADRWRIRLTLQTKTAAEAAGSDFVSFLTIYNKEIVFMKGGNTEYNEIEKRMATRTREESGNYLVDQFLIRFSEGDSDGVLNLQVNPFVAYVNGFRTEWLNIDKLVIPKPLSTTTSDDFNGGNVPVRILHRNYITLDSASGIDNLNFELSALQQLNLYDSVAVQGNIIGTIQVQELQKVGNSVNLYFFNTKINDGQTFRNTKSIGLDSDNYVTPTLQDGNLYIKDPGALNCFVGMPYPRPQSINVGTMTFDVQREFEITTNGSGEGVLTCAATESFQDEDDWIFVNTTDSAETIVPIVDIDLGTPQQATISNLGISDNYKVYAYINKGTVSAKTKTLTTSTVTAPLTVDSSGTYLNLGQYDIFDIKRLRTTDSDGDDIRARFSLDNGQRDNFYGPGKIVLKGGKVAPQSTNVFVRFRHFTHSTSGDFFCVNSYDSAVVPYVSIPTYHTSATNQTIHLTDVLDFRSNKLVDSDFTEANVIEIPRNRSTVSLDVTNYNSRIDVLTMSDRGQLGLITGTEALDPKAPGVGQGLLPLYTIRYGARTLTSSDVVHKPHRHKRYKMSDIQNIETRLENLEEVTSLSLLEAATDNLIITDDTSTIRTKSGFFVDDFANYPEQAGSEVNGDWDFREQTSSYSSKTNWLYPRVEINSIRLVYDSDNSVNTKRVGNSVFLDYVSTADSDFSQILVSDYITVNPFDLTHGQGKVRISPASDNWIESRQLPDIVINNP
jgi:hypothetical protein